MTNQEVINFLDQVREILLDDKSWLESTIQPINEAFDIAISAVRAQDVPDTNVGDMVSRQKAIDALLKEVRLVDGYYVENDEVIDKDDAIEAIRLLPSAQSEPCEDAVNRQRLLDDLKKLKTAWKKYPVMAEQIKGVEAAIGYAEAIPSVMSKRKTGKWIEERRSIKVTLYKCSECGRTVMDDTGYDVTKDYPFCHCGADMNGSE